MEARDRLIGSANHAKRLPGLEEELRIGSGQPTEAAEELLGGGDLETGPEGAGCVSECEGVVGLTPDRLSEKLQRGVKLVLIPALARALELGGVERYR